MASVYSCSMTRRHPSNPINQLIIHCAATPNGRWHTAEDIDRWHAERGFKRNPSLIGYSAPHMPHIGYHFVVLTSGAVQVGRGTGEMGAHAYGHNRGSLGVCLIGTNQYTSDQWDALRALVTGMKSRFKNLKIIGHNEVNQKKRCPGFDVRAWLSGGMTAPDDHLLSDEDAQ